MSQTVVNRSISIFIESGAAQRALDKLLEKQKSLNAELQKTRDPARQKELQQDLARLADPIDRAQKKLRGELNPSLRELRSTLNSLKKELNNVEAGTQEFNRLSLAVRRATGELRAAERASKAVGEAADEVEKSNAVFSGAFWGTVAANAVGFLSGKLQELGARAFEVLQEIQGVRRAFDNLDRPELLSQLREATSGTVSDLELMKRAVASNNFQIPLDNLATYFKFAQQRAKETGESVDFLVNSIVVGIGRKSPLILDNLGISAARVSEEFQRTGDFGAAAANIINEEMQKMGVAVEDAGTKVKQLRTFFTNVLDSSSEGLASILVNISDALVFTLGDTEGKAAIAARKGAENLSKQNTNFRNRELKQIEFYTKEYAKADQAGRDQILEQLRAEIRITQREEEVAFQKGQTNLQQLLQGKLSMYKNFLTQLESGTSDGSVNTIEALEQELSILQGNLKKMDISSKKFADQQKEIARVQQQLNNATGKTAEDASRKSEQAKTKLDALRKTFNQFDADLRKSLLGATYGEMFTAYFEINQDAEGKIKQLAEFLSKGIINREQYNVRVKDIQFILEAKRDELNKKFAEKPIKLPVQIGMDAATAADADEVLNKLFKDIGPKLERGLKELEATFDLDVLLAGTDRERLDAELSKLEFLKSHELAAKNLTEAEKLLIEEQYRQKRQAAEANFIEAQVQQYLSLATQALSIYSSITQIQNQNDQQQLQSLDNANNRKKASYDRLLNQNLISRREYDKRIAELDKQNDQKRIAIEKRQFERNKRAQIIQAGINGAMAITSTLAALPGPFDIATLGAFRAAQIALSVATVATQIALISKQKPPQYGDGGKLYGPSHAQNNGMPVTNPLTGQVQAYVEGGEGIVNKRTMSDRGVYELRGTPSQIASALNSLHGGKSWEPGAKFTTPVWKTTKSPSINYAAANRSYSRIFADGGVMPGAEGGISSSQLAVFEKLNQNMEQMSLLLSDLQANGVPGYILWNELQDKQRIFESIQKNATLR
jgi:hypothetical protein